MAKNEDAKLTMPLKDKIEAQLLEQRRLFLCDAIDNDTAEEMIRKLWYLEAIDQGKPITLVINSPGGSVDAGFAIWDQIMMISSPVITIVTGLAASMATVLALAGKERFATPNSRFMLHQPRLSGVIQGQATDLEIQAKEMLNTKANLLKIYESRTGKTSAEIEKVIDRDTWMSAKEALSFGLLDKIITSFKDAG